MPAGFAQVFGGNTLYPSSANYQALTLTASVTLTWPTEQQIAGQSVASAIIDVTSTLPALTITLPSAQLVSPGYVLIFNNLGLNSFSVLNALGGTLLSVPAGQVWTAYLADNSTPQGIWRIYQQGAGTSVANAASLAGSGLQAIGAFLNQVMAVNTQTANYTVQLSDQADVIVWVGGTGTLTLPAPSVLGSGWFSAVKNLGSGSLTLTPSSGLIDLAASKVLNQQDSFFLGSDGTQYFTVGFGRAVASTFSFVSINVAGSGTFVLSGGQLNQVSYRFTGALTGTRTIQVPSSVQQYWIDNETSGAFSLFIATSTQSPGISVGQGQQAILFCDGTNVLTANSSAVSFPISVPNGGTGLTTVGLGDILYGSATNIISRLIGTASASRVFLSETGNGVTSAPPVWTGLQPTDLGSGPASVSTFLRGNQVWGGLLATDLGSGIGNTATLLRGDQTWTNALLENQFGVGFVCALSTYEFSTFTTTATGFSGTVTGVVGYARVGPMVVLTLPGLTGTSNAVTCTASLPARLTPATAVFNSSSFFGLDNGIVVGAIASVGPTGLAFSKGAGGFSAWTASGTKSVGGVTLVYFLA